MDDVGGARVRAAGRHRLPLHCFQIEHGRIAALDDDAHRLRQSASSSSAGNVSASAMSAATPTAYPVLTLDSNQQPSGFNSFQQWGFAPLPFGCQRFP
jgi:hypothetical protein